MYVFIDEGEPGDEQIGVGPFLTEEAAREAGGDHRVVIAVLSQPEFERERMFRS